MKKVLYDYKVLMEDNDKKFKFSLDVKASCIKDAENMATDEFPEATFIQAKKDLPQYFPL